MQHAAALQHLRTKFIGWKKVAGSLPVFSPLRKVAGPKLLEQHVELDRSLGNNILCCSAISIRFEARSRSPTHALRRAGTTSRIVLLRRLTRVVTLGRVHLAISAAKHPCHQRHSSQKAIVVVLSKQLSEPLLHAVHQSIVRSIVLKARACRKKQPS